LEPNSDTYVFASRGAATVGFGQERLEEVEPTHTEVVVGPGRNQFENPASDVSGNFLNASYN